MKQMDRAALEGVELEYEVRGAFCPSRRGASATGEESSWDGGGSGCFLRPSPALGIF
jgi:hypothetical protein